MFVDSGKIMLVEFIVWYYFDSKCSYFIFGDRGYN